MEQEFINFIKQLLACNNWEEVKQMLINNQQLIVPRLLPVMAETAEFLGENGNTDDANFLFHLTLRLGEFLGSSQIPPLMKETANALSQIGIKIKPVSFSIQCLQNAFIIYREIKDSQGEGLVLLKLGVAYKTLGEYEQAMKSLKQYLEIAREIKDRQGEAIALLNLGAVYKALEQYKQVINFCQESLEITREIKDRQMEAILLQNLGAAYGSLGQYERAIEFHQQYLEIAREIKNRQGEAIALRNLGFTCKNLGQYEQEIKFLKQYLEIARELKKRQDEAFVLGILGDAYQALGQYEQAISLHQESLEIARDIKDSQIEAIALEELSVAYSNLGQYEQQIKFAKQFLKITREIKDYQGEAVTLGSLGIAYNDLGKHEQAIDFHHKSLEIAQKIEDRQSEAFALRNLGAAYKDLGQYEQAMSLHQRSLEIARDIKDRRSEAYALGNLGVICHYLKQYEQEINFCRQHLEIVREIKDYKGEAIALGNLGVAYDDLEQYEQAIDFSQKYLETARKIKYSQGEAIALGNLGVVYYNLRQYKQAIANFQKSLKIATPKAMPVDCARNAVYLGYLHFTQGNWENAIAAYTQAIEATEILRTGRQTDDRRQEILKNAIGVYANIIQCFVNTGQYTQAFTYAEQSRNRQLVDLMYTKDVYHRGETPPEVVELLQQYEGIQRQLDNLRFNNESSNYNQEMIGTANPGQIQAFWQTRKDRIIALEADKQEIYRQIRKLDRVLAEGLAVKPLEFDQLQNLLRNSPTTAIVSFFSTEEDTYAFILVGDRVDLHRCGHGFAELQRWLGENWFQPYSWSRLPDSARPSLSTIAAAKLLECDLDAIASAKPETDTVAIFLKDGSRHSADKAEFNKLRKQLAYTYDWHQQMPSNLKEISQRLQLDKLLEKLTGIQELIIVPHLYLHQIPFAALPLANNQNLGDKFLIRTQSSCQTLDFCTQRDPVSTQPNAFGIVEDTQEDLPCSSFEAQQVAKIYSVPADKYLQGTAATVRTYKQLLQQVQGVLSSHHAISRLDNSLESSLILADGAITLSDLLSPALRFRNLDEVFLSCCETNLGTTEITDDTMTLNTGFLCAGARGAISSLWAVDDLATSLFSLYYHQQRKAGKNRPQALQKAQQDLRQLTGREFAAKYYGELERMLDEKLQLTSEKKAEAKQKLDACAEDAPEYPQLKLEYEKRERLEKRILATKDKRLKAVCQQEHPFEHPEDWSGFICAGLR